MEAGSEGKGGDACAGVVITWTLCNLVSDLVPSRWALLSRETLFVFNSWMYFAYVRSRL